LHIRSSTHHPALVLETDAKPGSIGAQQKMICMRTRVTLMLKLISSRAPHPFCATVSDPHTHNEHLLSRHDTAHVHIHTMRVNSRVSRVGPLFHHHPHHLRSLLLVDVCMCAHGGTNLLRSCQQCEECARQMRISLSLATLLRQLITNAP
jgi:hypothetical protein